jgi:amino acid adenylation domain-containing protein
MNERIFTSGMFADAKKYWLNKLSGDLTPPDLSGDFPGTYRYKAGNLSMEFTNGMVEKLTLISKNNDLSMYVILLAAFKILLYKFSGQGDLIVSAPTLKESRQNYNQWIALRDHLHPGMTFKEFLMTIKETVVEGYKNQYYPIRKLIKLLDIKPTLSLFKVIMLLDTIHDREYVDDIKEDFENDIIVSFSKNGGGLGGEIRYNALLFKKEFIQGLFASYRSILTRVLADTNVRIADLDVITGEEKQRILVEFNKTAAADSDWQDKTIQGLFEEQAVRTPDHIALVGPSVSVEVMARAIIRSPHHQITYKKLNENATRLAHLLIEKGVGPDTIVGLMVERSIDMIAAILGILKAGGAYLPLDPDFPGERIKYMLEDSEAKILVTVPGLSGKLKKLLIVNCQLLIVNESLPNCQRLNNPPKEANLINNYQLTINNLQLERVNLAYILYTSGSTGMPKGVMVEQRNVTRLVKNPGFIHLQVGQRLLMTGAITFDIAVFEIWAPLVKGLSLYLATDDIILDPFQLGEVIGRYHITILHLVPQLFNQVLSQDPGIFAGLTHFLVGGDRVQPGFVYRLRKEYPQLKILHMYGPTENTTFSTCYPVEGADEYQERLPIGRPVNHTAVFIIGKDNQLLPIGVGGELWTGGAGVARGYLNNPELTSERFIKYKHNYPHMSFNLHRSYKSHPSYIYKTGDLARWLPDGNLEFLGRVDHQVKIRGNRIELGEIEHRLLGYDGVKDAAVIAVNIETGPEKGEKYLCAYIVPGANGSSGSVDGTFPGLEVSRLREYLGGILPGYMIPAYFVMLSHIPLTASGKLDRRALPRHEITGGDGYTAPRDAVEQRLVDLWAEILAVDPQVIGIHANFFELGGHSLKATILSARIHEKYDIKIPVTRIFEEPTVAQLAKYIKPGHKDKYIPIERAEKKEFYPLSFHQQRLWIIHQMDTQSTSFNMPQVVSLDHRVDENALKKAFAKIAARHEILRTYFRELQGQPHQLIEASLEIPFAVVDISSLSGPERQERRREIIEAVTARTFDLRAAPLFTSILVKLAEERFEFVFNMHHIISDGWSMQVLGKEFFHLYEDYRAGREPDLGPVKIQYRDFCRWYHSQLAGNTPGGDSHDFWRSIVEAGIPVLALPYDNPQARRDPQGAAYVCALDKKTTDILKRLSQSNNTSLFMVLFSAFLLVLYRLCSQQEIVCSVIGSGRENLSLHETVGFFVNSILIPVGVKPGEVYRDFLNRVKKTALEAFKHQDYPLELVFEELKMRYPDIPVSFNMMTDEEGGVDFDGGTFQPYYISDSIDAKFDIEPYVTEYRRGLHFHWSCKRHLFKPGTIAYIANEYLKLLKAIAGNPGFPIKDYPIFCAAGLSREMWGMQETREVGLIEPGASFLEFKKQDIHGSIVSRFEQQVERYPEHSAVVTGKGEWTYRQLNRVCNRIAHAVIQRCGTREQGAALLFAHDRDMIAAILGALKSGKYYIPLDPSYPARRLEYMLMDSRAGVLLFDDVHEALARQLVKEAGLGVRLINTGTLGSCETDENPGIETAPGDWAYILYTSGSTGVPKGVIQTHGHVLHFIRVYTNNLRIHAQDRLTLFSSYTFDAAVMDIYAALLNGAVLYPFDIRKEENLSRLPGWLKEEKITLYHSIPTVFRYFTDVLREEEARGEVMGFPHLRCLVMGGEAVYKEDVDNYKIYFSSPGCFFVNGLGPTESTVTLQYFIDRETPITKNSVPVGFPVEDTKVMIMDETGEESRVFAEGEIVFQSHFLAPGYLNDPGKTHEAFNFCGGPGGSFFKKRPLVAEGKKYRTGDLGRRLPGNIIEYIGRKDHQVKIRGYRVEPREVEILLNQWAGIRESVVVAQAGPTGDNHLIAFYVSIKDVDENGLVGMLTGMLPAYMVPRYFERLDRLPLTPTGKIDRKSLQEYRGQYRKLQVAYVAPKADLEKQIARLVKEMLHLDSIGIYDNFFDLGFTSMDMMRLKNKLKSEIDKDIPVIALFRFPTISAITRVLEEKEFKEGLPDDSGRQKLLERKKQRQGRSPGRRRNQE